MKKVILLTTLTVSLLLFTGCKSNSEPEEAVIQGSDDTAPVHFDITIDD